MKPDTLIGYIFDTRKQRYYAVYSIDNKHFYEECEPTEVDDERIFADDVLCDEVLPEENWTTCTLDEL